VQGLAPKTVRNIVGTLSALMNFATRRRWASANPCDGAERPTVPDATAIRFLTLAEVDALVAHARPGEFEAIDAALYRTAAMTGVRLGELLALRWLDVDWMAARVRVRQNYVMGEFGTPKSRRSTRSVPMADEVGGALERLFKASRWQADDDLVFAHPATGRPAVPPGRHAPPPQGAARGRAQRPARVPRPAPHVRHADGRREGADAHVAGVDGPPRHRDDAALRGLRAERARGRAGGRRVRPW
jgi:integrase